MVDALRATCPFGHEAPVEGSFFFFFRCPCPSGHWHPFLAGLGLSGHAHFHNLAGTRVSPWSTMASSRGRTLRRATSRVEPCSLLSLTVRGPEDSRDLPDGARGQCMVGRCW